VRFETIIQSRAGSISIRGHAGSISILNRDRDLLTGDRDQPSRDSHGVPMGLRPTKSDEGAAGGWCGINDLRRVFNRAVVNSFPGSISIPNRDGDLLNRDREGAAVNSFRYQRDDGEAAEGEFSISTLDAGAFSILIGGRAYRVEPGAPGEWIVNGTPIAAKLFDPRAFRERQGSATSQGRVNIVAPMPGKIVRVLVSNGDTIEEGQGLLVVEAMKMQNEMKSPKAGRVVEVRAKAGSSVAAGEVLMVVE